MPHAQIDNKVTCSADDCVQPGTDMVLVAMDGETPIEFEFCVRHAGRDDTTPQSAG